MFKVGTLYQQRRGCGGATRINHWLFSKLLLSAKTSLRTRRVHNPLERTVNGGKQSRRAEMSGKGRTVNIQEREKLCD